MNRRAEKLLVQRMRSGDHDAYVQLVELHHAPIYRLLVRLCRNAHLAEDLTQETFAAAWAGLKAFRGASSLGTWLHRIAYRKFLDAHRRDHPLPRQESSDQALEGVQSREPGQFEVVLRDERTCRLQTALDALEPEDRHILVLHYMQGLSFREMAAVLDESVGTTKWRTSQALAHLRGILEGSLSHET